MCGEASRDDLHVTVRQSRDLLMPIDKYVENGLTDGVERQVPIGTGIAAVRLRRAHIRVQPVHHQLRDAQHRSKRSRAIAGRIAPIGYSPYGDVLRPRDQAAQVTDRCLPKGHGHRWRHECLPAIVHELIAEILKGNADGWGVAGAREHETYGMQTTNVEKQKLHVRRVMGRKQDFVEDVEQVAE